MSYLNSNDGSPKQFPRVFKSTDAETSVRQSQSVEISRTVVVKTDLKRAPHNLTLSRAVTQLIDVNSSSAFQQASSNASASLNLYNLPVARSAYRVPALATPRSDSGKQRVNFPSIFAASATVRRPMESAAQANSMFGSHVESTDTETGTDTKQRSLQSRQQGNRLEANFPFGETHPSSSQFRRTRSTTQFFSATPSSSASVVESVDFRSKCIHFRRQLQEARPPRNDPYNLRIRRSHLVQDSFDKIMAFKNTRNLTSKLTVQFQDEKGIDCGGILREWFSLLSAQLFHPDYGLFEYSTEDHYSVRIRPNSHSAVGAEHMDLFRFAGRLMGLAVYHQQLLNVTFAPQFCRALLGKPISVDDVKDFDPELYQSLNYILDNDPSSLELTFSVTDDRLGKSVEHDLKPDGRQIAVTQSNKHEYLQAMIDYKFVAAVRKQTETLRKAFFELVPLRLLSMFDEQELCLLFGGEADIDVQDWRNNTRYSGGYSEEHRVIDWFWQAVTSFTAAQRSQLLQFVTGCSRLPAAGFADLRGSGIPRLFEIGKIPGITQLPRAHTCFNRLDLPEYKTYEELRSKLLLAAENGDVIDGVD